MIGRDFRPWFTGAQHERSHPPREIGWCYHAPAWNRFAVHHNRSGSPRVDQRALTSLLRFASMTNQLEPPARTSAKARDDGRQILDTAAIGLTRCNRDLRYLSCNPAYENLVGLSDEQIIGRRIIDVIGMEAFEVKRPYVERVLRGERVEYEEEVPFAAGRPRFLHVVYTPWIEADHVAGWMASVSDITDLKRTTEAL